MGAKTEPKTKPETGPLKKGRSSEQKILCSKKGSEMVHKKGGPCGMLASFLLRCCFLLDFGDFRAHFGTEFVQGKGVGGRVNPPNWMIGRVLNLNHLSPEGWWDFAHGLSFFWLGPISVG